MERIECLQVQKFTFPNAIINVHFPDLTNEKRKQRTKTMQKASEALLKSYGRRAAECQPAFK